MSLGKFAGFVFGFGVGAYLYGAIYGVDSFEVVRRQLVLRRWPKKLNGFKIVVVSDLHVRDQSSADLGRDACLAALSEKPDLIVLPGDFVAGWKPGVFGLLWDALEPLRDCGIPCVAVCGNHEGYEMDPEEIRPILDDMGIIYLRNENITLGGVTVVGVDSALFGTHDLRAAYEGVKKNAPTIVLWHEPDVADQLPFGAHLVIAGHSHGGQFCFPWGKPVTTPKMGRRFVSGFFERDLPVPLYVSRGVGTTGPPSRLFCPAEVSVLTLVGD